MARAYLNIGSDLLRVFNNAQETKDHRLIIAKIKDEDILYDTSYMIEDTLENDFNNLTQNFTDNEPCFALFNLSSNLESSLNSNSLSWLLLSWVPDNSKVKLKMLYSSSVEDVKQALGLSYFSSDFHCSERTELSWSFYEKYNKNNKEFDIGLLSEKERLILEEKVLSSQESTNVKSTALGVIPFTFSPTSLEALENFYNDKINFLSLNLVDEVVQVLNEEKISNEQFSSSSLSLYVNNETPSFILLRYTSSLSPLPSLFFIYSCPELSSIKEKMVMSSSKATVLGEINSRYQLNFLKTFELRDPIDLDDLIKEEFISSSSPTSLSSSAAASLSHSKPTRPGRGKARITKFSE